MPKNILSKLRFSPLLFILLILLLFGCGNFETTQTTKSGSGSGAASQEVPAHGQATVNLLERAPFKGRDLDPTFWNNMEAYCKAGPTQLIIADMNLIPSQMNRAGFSAPENQLYYALASTYAGMNWSPGDATSQVLSDNRDQIDAWWSRYIQAVVRTMQKAPQTTAVVIINDGPDRLGSRLGNETYKNMGAVISRVRMGDTIP